MTNRRTLGTVFATVLVGLGLLAGVVVMATRVGDEARFVTWPVVGFTAIAAVVALLGIRAGWSRPPLLAVGSLLALFGTYLLLAAPFPLVAAVLVCLGGLAVTAGGVAAGMAAGTGTLMVAAVVLQGPAVECGASGVSSSSGPWWIEERASSSGSGSMSVGGVAEGSTRVGDRRYVYRCDGGRLVSFDRVD